MAGRQQWQTSGRGRADPLGVFAVEEFALTQRGGTTITALADLHARKVVDARARHDVLDGVVLRAGHQDPMLDGDLAVVEFRDALPKSPIGKILRRELRTPPKT